MDQTGKNNIKFCKVCEENVYLCINDQELIEALKNNRCVAMYNDGGEKMPTLIGDVDATFYT
jgi:hypothetical protein